MFSKHSFDIQRKIIIYFLSQGHLKGYCWRESRAKTIASVKWHFKMFSKPLSPFPGPKTNKRVFQSEPEVVLCFELNYKFLERHKKTSVARENDWPKRLTLLLICQRNDSFDSWLWNGFLERALRTILLLLLFSFFLILLSYVIQGKFITWLVNSALNCTWKPISHSSRCDSCDIGFRVQFNAEFPRQVMNFSIVVNIIIVSVY